MQPLGPTRASVAPLMLRAAPTGVVDEVAKEHQLKPGMWSRENAKRLDGMFQRLVEDSGGFEGADGVYSARVTRRDGSARDVFGFGDTYIGPKLLGMRLPPNRFNFIRHTVSELDGDEFRTIVRDTSDRVRDVREWIQPMAPRPDGSTWRNREWYWPGGMVQTEAGVQLVLERFNYTGPDVRWDWAHVGTDVATLDPDTLEVIDQRTVSTGPVMWGSAVLKRPDHVYVYGAAERDAKDGKDLVVARTQADDLAQGWEYRTADGRWSPNVADAAPQTGVHVSPQFSVIDSPEGGVDLIAQEGFYPVLRTYHADDPAGPFVRRPGEVHVPAVEHPKYVYNALVHPQWSDEHRLVVSVNQNRFDGVGFNPTDYRPRFFTMPRPEDLDPERPVMLEYGR